MTHAPASATAAAIAKIEEEASDDLNALLSDLAQRLAKTRADLATTDEAVAQAEVAASDQAAHALLSGKATKASDALGLHDLRHKLGALETLERELATAVARTQTKISDEGRQNASREWQKLAAKRERTLEVAFSMMVAGARMALAYDDRPELHNLPFSLPRAVGGVDRNHVLEQMGGLVPNNPPKHIADISNELPESLIKQVEQMADTLVANKGK